MLRALVAGLRRKYPDGDYPDYTRGYLDCARYTQEWIEEQDEYDDIGE